MSDPAAAILDTLAHCRRVLLTTHIRPDGDALGSTAAMTLALRARGADAHVLLLSRLPNKYSFLFRDYGIAWTDVETGRNPAARGASDWDFDVTTYDALLVLDTGTWSQLPGLEARLAGWGRPCLVIDHHQTQETWGDHRLVDTSAAAAGEIVADLLARWGRPLDTAIATCLYAAIATDTGWFAFSNTTPRTLRLAAGLMEAGVDTDRLYQLLYQSERPERLALQTRALQSLRYAAGGRLAIMTLTREDFDQTGASVLDTENLINIPLQVATVQASLLAIEPREPGPVRISLRSKGQVNVARLAERFGGGGHARAAGLKLPGSLADACARVAQAVTVELAGPA